MDDILSLYAKGRFCRMVRNQIVRAMLKLLFLTLTRALHGLFRLPTSIRHHSSRGSLLCLI
ncbi:hypothetical protein BG259_28115 (plasmid) [Vibrio harveyi]|nr:hypothetical protein BG259_28115 [Vibrio harveyi]